jgi:Domain of unknown function (DUF5011)
VITASGNITHVFTANGSFTYTFVDASGNTGSTTATVTNIDTIAPVITLIGSGTITVPQTATQTYSDSGATFTEVNQAGATSTGTLTASSGSVDTTTLGTYVLTFTKTDAAGNIATPVTRTVTVSDQTPPTASLLYNNSGSLITSTTSTGLTVTNQSVTATLTGASETITITNSTGVVITASGNITHVFTANGSFIFTFVDASGNTGSTTATVTNIDTIAPVITLIGSGTITVLQNSIYTDSGATCTDTNTCTLTSTGTVNTANTGSYTITYRATDVVGNTATPVTRTVIVVLAPDTVAPVITLLGSATMTISQGNIFTDPGATCSDDRDPTCTVTATGSVNTLSTGSYTITYRASDLAGNTAIVQTRTVTVVAAPDTTAPVISLSGSTVISLTQ